MRVAAWGGSCGRHAEVRGHRLSTDWILLTDLVYRHRQYEQGVYQRDARNGSQVHNKTLSLRGTNAGKKKTLEGEHRYTKPPPPPQKGKSLARCSYCPKWQEGRERGRWGGGDSGEPIGSRMSVCQVGFHHRLDKVRSLLSKVAW